jgi:hypothetical protein
VQAKQSNKATKQSKAKQSKAKQSKALYPSSQASIDLHFD